jgi:hypothetical protein
MPDIMKNYSFGSGRWFSVNSELSYMDYKIFLKIKRYLSIKSHENPVWQIRILSY